MDFSDSWARRSSGLWRPVASNGIRVLPLSNHLFEESEPGFEESEAGNFNLAGGLD